MSENFPLEAPKKEKISRISKTSPQTIPPDTKSAVSQALQSLRPQNSKKLWIKGRKRWKKILLTKRFFLLKTFLWTPRMHYWQSYRNNFNRCLKDSCSKPEYDIKLVVFRKKFCPRRFHLIQKEAVLTLLQNFFRQSFQFFFLRVEKE